MLWLQHAEIDPPSGLITPPVQRSNRCIPSIYVPEDQSLGVPGSA